MDDRVNDSNELSNNMLLFSACNAARIGVTACMLCGNCNKRSKVKRKDDDEKEMQQGKREKENIELKES